ncbi:amidohydrolase family protein [Nocardia sp. CDC153]|uniref:amidohydrolase family protein n=1 Tax=Nocardia sp. CDC153 TaxID=3112167 RepID=UPI002DBA5A42|nr:amidohydrolase family protein [Nocardia sp. CDC153]MEC3953940.1 amidohydrolase family protein [Nocardia sp. CDC153]
MIGRRTLLAAAGLVPTVALTGTNVEAKAEEQAPAAGGLIDLHSHFLPDFYVDEARRAGIAFPDGMPFWPSWSVESHLAMMDATGIDRAVLSISSPGVHFGDAAAAAALARRVNDFAAHVAAEHPGRFGNFAALPLPDIAASVAEAVRALDELHADGVTLLSNAAGTYLGNLTLAPLLTVLNDRSARVFVHPTSPPNANVVNLGRPAPLVEFLFDSARTAVDLVATGQLQRFPRIRWIFSHGGGVMPLVADRVDYFRNQAGLDKVSEGAVSSFQKFWYDTAGTPLPRQLPALTSLVGTEQVVYGSDYCFTSPAAAGEQANSLRNAGEASDWATLTTANATRLLTS